jgi:YbgC/YbaW family acyl-CoA thioester hydrolase
MKIPESTHTIRFPDCDPFNHLNNSRYIDYFINAREDHLMNVFKFDMYRSALETGRSWVVSQNQIAYFAPAMLMEQVVIQSLVLEWNTSDALVEMRMWNQSKSKLKALLWTRFVHFDLKTQKRIDHEPAVTEIFMKQLVPLDYPADFEKRIAEVRGKKYEEMLG